MSDDSYATRVSRQLDQMMRERALQHQREREAKATQQTEAQKQAKAPSQPENRSTVEQITQDRQATEKALREAGVD